MTDFLLRGISLLAGIGNFLISCAAKLLILLLLAYGGYSLWDTAVMYRGAFVSEDLLQYKPAADTDNTMGADGLRDLQLLNEDVCGWLTIDGTNIDYPLLQGEDDMEYINKDVFGEFAFSGSLFLDSRNSVDFSDYYSLIYGHHMDNGAMFGDLVNFTEQEYFETHRTGTLYLLDGSSLEISIFACVEADAYDSVIYQPDLCRGENRDRILERIEEKAVCVREIDPGERRTDRLIGFSTCAQAETNGRVIVYGWLK